MEAVARLSQNAFDKRIIGIRHGYSALRRAQTSRLQRSASINLHVRVVDDLHPFQRIGFHEFAELLRRARDRLIAVRPQEIQQ
jgi:hypothetical protein